MYGAKQMKELKSKKTSHSGWTTVERNTWLQRQLNKLWGTWLAHIFLIYCLKF